jgi:uncharacterized protein YjbI with pentapeptide repeats
MHTHQPEPCPSDGLPALKFQGKTVALVGQRKNWSPDSRLPQLIEAEGGRMVEDVTADVHFLVVYNPSPRGQWAAEKKAEQINRKRGAHIRVIDVAAFWQLLSVQPEEALALLRGGEEGVRRWNLFCEFKGWAGKNGIALPPLDGTDFRGARLSGVHLRTFDLDGCDFREADLTGAGFGWVKQARFDGARLGRAGFWRLIGCTLVGADLTLACFDDVRRCDLTKAVLEGGHLSRSTLEENIFRDANLRGADFEKSVLRGNDYAGADLGGAKLEEATFAGELLHGVRLDNARMARGDFTGAILTKASLAGADLNKAVLAGADLRDADLRGANLANADLTGARLAGADFTGANVLGARIDPDQASAAKGLAPAAPVDAPRTHLHELDVSAPKTQRFVTNIVLEQGEEWVHAKAWVIAGRGGARAGTGWHLYSPTRDHLFEPENAPSLSAGMVALANLWHAAAPALESVRIEAKKEPKRKDLWALAVRAWAEAFNLPAPDDRAVQEMKDRRPAVRRRWRDLLLAELRTGADGVARWNRRGIFLHEMLDDFTEADLREADLTGVFFHKMNLSSARFDGAFLGRGRFDSCGAQSASFRGAKMEESRSKTPPSTRRTSRARTCAGRPSAVAASAALISAAPNLKGRGLGTAISWAPTFPPPTSRTPALAGRNTTKRRAGRPTTSRPWRCAGWARVRTPPSTTPPGR